MKIHTKRSKINLALIIFCVFIGLTVLSFMKSNDAKADSSQYQLVCVLGKQFVRTNDTTALTQVWTNGTYVDTCQD